MKKEENAHDDAEKPEDTKRSTNYFDLREVFMYYFRKRDPNRPSNINIRIMHGINRIAIIIFLICLIVIIVRFITRAL